MYESCVNHQNVVRLQYSVTLTYTKHSTRNGRIQNRTKTDKKRKHDKIHKANLV